MSFARKALLVISVLLMSGCGPAPQPVAATLVPPTLTPTPRFMGDACAQAPLQAYLGEFSAAMKAYEISLAQIFSLTVGSVTSDAIKAEIKDAQAARDALAGIQAPYCAEKMHAHLLSSMDHTITALNDMATDRAKSRTEFSQAQVDFGTAKLEFNQLSTQAGLNLTPTP